VTLEPLSEFVGIEQHPADAGYAVVGDFAALDEPAQGAPRKARPLGGVSITDHRLAASLLGMSQ
jgi:hypothetical protein